MSFSGLFQTQGMLFLTMLIGYIFGKKGLADDNGKSLLTDLVLFVTLPASILKSFQIEFNHQILIACMTIAIAGVVIQIGSYVLGMFLYNHYGESRKKVLQYATICSNAGILGKSYCRRDFWADGNDVCIHICDPAAHFYVVCRSYIFYRGTR